MLVAAGWVLGVLHTAAGATPLHSASLAMVATRRIVEPTDPYPPSGDFRIVGYRYVDHLSLVRYNARPSGSETASDWQLAEHYAVEIDIDYRGEDGQRVEECWRIKAPRGLYTDLSSVPAFGRWIVSKVGPHLEASIIHDYLYMKWTDDRLDNRRFSDWVFADECLRAGMKDLGEFSWFQRFVVNFAVGTVGWFVFKNKTDRFSAKLALWTPHLDYLPPHAGAAARPGAAQGPVLVDPRVFHAHGDRVRIDDPDGH